MRLNRYISIICIIAVFGCSQKAKIQKPNGNPLILGFNETIDFSLLKEGHIREATDYILWIADESKDKIINISNSRRDYKNTLLGIDELNNLIDLIANPVKFISLIYPVVEIQNEARKANKRIENYKTELSFNEDLYEAVVNYSNKEEAKNLSGYKIKYLEDTLLNYKRLGFSLPQEDRLSVKMLFSRLNDLSLEFDKNILEAQDTLFLDKSQVGGLPKNFLIERLQEDGNYAIECSHPSFDKFMRFAESDEARKLFRHKFYNRAANKNIKILNQILLTRKDLAKILGYKSFAEYYTENTMAKNPKNVWSLNNDLKQKLRKKSKRDLAELMAIKSSKTGEKIIYNIQPWESEYYENKVKLNKYNLDTEEIKQYFEFNNVNDGLFKICDTLFGIKFKKIDHVPVWFSDVQAFQVYDFESNELIGSFYLDIFSRKNKYDHPNTFNLVKGKKVNKGYQKPVLVLTSNFPMPEEGDPLLLSHENVKTYFHEFGHLLQGLLNKSDLSHYSGISVKQNFSQFSSHILENYVWKKESLELIGKHFETGETIPAELINKIVAAKNVNSGNKELEQVFYATYDLTLNDRFDPDGKESTTDLFRRLVNQITLFPFQEDTYQEASSKFLNRHRAAYYEYKFLEVYAHDIFSVFEQEGILSSKIGKRYREMILDRVGTKDPTELVSKFLGRKPNSNAFLRNIVL